MTGKADMVSVLDLPSHLSQPSQSKNVPIFDSGTRCYFAPENHAFGANPGKEKGDSQPRRTSRRLPAVLPPADRCVASQGEGGVRIPPSLFGRVLGSFSVRRKRSRRKGRRRGRPRPGHFCPQCGQLSEGYHRGHSTALSVVGGVKSRKSPAVAGKIAGSQLHFREETANDK